MVFCVIRVKQFSKDVVCGVVGFIGATAVDFIRFDRKRHGGFVVTGKMDASGVLFLDLWDGKYSDLGWID
jgi:hypothetical protein